MKNFSVILTLLGLLITSGSVFAHDNNKKSSKHRNQHNHGHSNDHYEDHYNDRDDDYSWCNESHDHARYHGQRRNNYSPMAKVVNVRPVYRYSEQRYRSECDSGYYSRNRDHTGLILGGIIGGVVGHELGHGGYHNRHRDGATAAGVIVGAAVGNQYDRRASNRRNCDSYSRTSRQLKGYEMTYWYKGRTRHTFVHRKPPKYFRIEDLRHYR